MRYRMNSISVELILAALALCVSAVAGCAPAPTPTPQPTATSTPNVGGTATAYANATATEHAAADANATATEYAAAQATNVAVLTRIAATRVADVTATAQVVMTTVDDLMKGARQFYGPEKGVIDRPDNSIRLVNTRQSLRNFIAEARFYNPADRAEHKWDYGYGFRRFGRASTPFGYRVYIDSDSTWGLQLVTDAGSSRPATGRVPNFDVTPSGSNLIRLFVNDKSAFLFVNGQFISRLDVSVVNDAGEVWLQSGMSGGTIFPGLATRYTDFVMSSLP